MFAFIATTVLKWLGDDALAAVFDFITTEIRERGLIVQGAQQQAAKENAVSAKVEQAIAQAESDAPHSRNEAIDALKKGTF